MILKNKTYHFYEFAISGLSGSGKSTLVSKILNQYKNEYKVFYAKHDAHHFDMDHPGKDTEVAIKSGATGISIFNESKWASVQNSPLSMIEKKLLSIDYDFTLVEGHKYTDIPKLLFIDADGSTLKEYREGKIKNVLGFISTDPVNDNIEGLRVFNRDDVEAISCFIINYFQAQYQQLPLNALVLVGGKSSRMGEEKSKINYHGDIQAKYLADILSRHCNQVFYSCRDEQSHDPAFSHYERISDQFRNIGPMGGILSYFQKMPQSRLLVVACDMPFVDKSSIAQLIKEESPFKVATAFINEDRKWPEPLFTIYQPKAYGRMLQLLSTGYDCPMKVLFQSDIKPVVPQNYNSIANINTPDERDQVKQKLEKCCE